jgi:hypothetical protein
MPMTEQEKLRRWADAWKSAGELMEKFRGEDLAILTDAEAARQFADLTKGILGSDMPDDGLLEQQRLFMKSSSWKN